MTALQAALRVIDAQASEDNWVAAAMADGLLRGYNARWGGAQDNLMLRACEKEYVAPLVNLATGAESRTYKLAGKIDKLVLHEGKAVVFDHKTTSSSIDDPDATYWRQLVVEGQPMHYELLLLANGIRVERTVWDVIKKPGIRPKKLTKAELKVVTSLGTYYDQSVTVDTRNAMSNDERENWELFAIRVAHDCATEPDKFFQRRSIPHLEEELVEYAQELWEIGQEVRLCRNSGRHYRNSGACMLYGSPCRFLGICSGHDRPDSDRWQKKESVHRELDDVEGEQNLLTNSRLRCFQTCRRKHYFEYELGIERVEEEEKEALAFGVLMHQALDAWWCTVSESVGEV